MKQYPGYTLVKHEDCPEQHGTLTVLTHDVSGASVLLVENDDDNKAFGIGFGTFPSDDTGVFHILEHSVLAGSEKYPVKSPFLQLLKSSMASFLNAMTFPDKTVYPFATPNETDFKNLMDVYLNAVFCPLAMVDKGVFEQEGWHRDEDGTVSGVVYNEMQGALASPEYAEANDLEWSDGQTLTAAIGQSYDLFTPLQLANYIATLVGSGQHYEAHLLKNVKSYDNSSVIYAYDKAPLNTVEMSDSTVQAVKEGMHNLTTGSLSYYFSNCVVSAGAKTGTAETGIANTNNGVFVCFAPYDDPQIAVAVVIEKGGSGAALASTAVDIVNSYFSQEEIGAVVIGENTLLK